MTLSISQEQPPESVDEELRSYLIRMFTDIDSTFRKPPKFTERTEQPPKPQKGDVHYFGDPANHNYDAAILVEGFWGFTEAGWEQLDGGGGGGSSSLQDAYDFDTSIPQIDINATPDPLTIDATVAGDVFAVRGFTDIDLLRLSTTGSALTGGHNNTDVLTLTGSAAGDLGFIDFTSPMRVTYNSFDAAQQFCMLWDETVAITGSYVGGMLSTSTTFDITTGVFIPAIFSDTNLYRINAAPGFSAITFINELSTVQNTGNFNLPAALVTNIGLVHARTTSGTSTTGGVTGISFAAQTRAAVSGAIMTKTAQTVMAIRPTFSTVAGSTVNLGTIIGLDCFQPAVALFQPQAGIENMTAYYAIRYPNMTFGGANRVYNCINSTMNAATNVRLINHTGNAASTHNGQLRFEADLVGVSFGLQQDLTLGYGAEFLFINFTGSGAGTAGQLRISSETAGNFAERFLFEGLNGDDCEFNINCQGFSLGAQSGSVGNQVGAFVAGTRTTQINGDWSDFLLTQAGNLTLNDTMGTVAGWTINAPSLSAGTGSAINATALLVGGNPGQATTDRTGVRIISNPSGGAGVNAALYVTVGRSRFDGIVDINNGVALGGGAVATLGTIGGAGPTAAAQAQWLQIEINGVNHWIPVWV